jgi:hypothetical protein
MEADHDSIRQLLAELDQRVADLRDPEKTSDLTNFKMGAMMVEIAAALKYSANIIESGWKLVERKATTLHNPRGVGVEVLKAETDLWKDLAKAAMETETSLQQLRREVLAERFGEDDSDAADSPH